MHSAAIFLGVLIFGWGANGLQLVQFIINMPDEMEGPWESFLDRWLPHLVAGIMLPLPFGLVVGGIMLVHWGFWG